MWRICRRAYESRSGRGCEYGGSAPGGIIVGIGLGILLVDFWRVIGIGARLVMMGLIAAIARREEPRRGSASDTKREERRFR